MRNARRWPARHASRQQRRKEAKRFRSAARLRWGFGQPLNPTTRSPLAARTREVNPWVNCSCSEQSIPRLTASGSVAPLIISEQDSEQGGSARCSASELPRDERLPPGRARAGAARPREDADGGGAAEAAGVPRAHGRSPPPHGAAAARRPDADPLHARRLLRPGQGRGAAAQDAGLARGEGRRRRARQPAEAERAVQQAARALLDGLRPGGPARAVRAAGPVLRLRERQRAHDPGVARHDAVGHGEGHGPDAKVLGIVRKGVLGVLLRRRSRRI